MFKITFSKDDMYLDMPGDNGLSLFEAEDRANIYKNRNPGATFSIVNEDNGDCEFQI